MIGLKRAALALALSAGCASASAQPSPILPGYWEARNKVSFPLPDESTSRQCITAEKVAQALSGPSNRHYQCHYTKARIGDGRVSAVGDCVDKNGIVSTIAVDGTYTATSFKLDAQLNVLFGGLTIPVRASTEAQRIADTCPVDPPG